ncbi:MAG: AAA family ATPase [Actinobacteria bacterium]|nr:AAA family ATPase [Actinomycetota bacterium]
MERFLMDELVKWRGSSRRKPLILNGARQVGKTWLLREFGRLHFKNVAYVNLDNNPRMKQQFEADYDIKRILLMIQAESGERIEPGETLVVLDEIQECPKALTSLKYFCENTPEQAVAVAGSLLGITVHEGTGYPVGKVSTLDLHPLSFREFLDATENVELRELIDSGDEVLIEAFSTKLIPLLRQYYYIGGMPEVVAAFLEEGAFENARRIQEDILFGYERDISKHLGTSETEYTLAAWNSIPAHLGQENKKFIFGHIKDGARARDYRDTHPDCVETRHYHEDYRMVSLYLAFRYPDQYALYDHEAFVAFLKKVQAKDIPLVADPGRYFKVVRTVYNLLAKDESLLELHYRRLDPGVHFMGKSMLLGGEVLAFG